MVTKYMNTDIYAYMPASYHSSWISCGLFNNITHSVYHSHARSWHGFQNEMLRRLLTVSLEENERIKITNDKELLLYLTN